MQATAAETTLQLAGMHCAACAGLIEDALGRVDGVLGARVSAAAQRATVQWDPARTRPSALVAAIRAAGYDAAADAEGRADGAAMRRAESRAALWRLFVAWFCSMQVMMFVTPLYLTAPGEIEPDLRQLLNWGSWVLSVPVVLFSAGPFFRSAWQGLRRRRIVMDLPVAIGVLVTFVASTGATFAPDGAFGHEVWFDSLTMFVAFLLAGRWFEMRSRHRAAEALEASLDRTPRKAWRVGADGADGAVTEVEAADLVAGDRVRVPVGEAFPADGRLVAGRTAVDEALLTGESAPVDKPEGSAVVAGSVNVGAPVEFVVERAGADTRFAAIVAMMRGALSARPAAAREADRWAGPFLWAVLLLAAGSAAAWSLVDPARALPVAVAVLIVTCPCALSLAAPATLVAAAGRLARRGVLVQRLDAIEALARVRRLYFDKTGTLTEERPVWRETRLLPGSEVTPQAVATAAAALAAWSSHPLSRALAPAADTPPSGWQGVEEQPGQGMRGCDADGVEWRLGSAAWCGVTEAARSAIDGDEAMQVWLARDGRPVAGFAFDESLRPGAAEALDALRADGVQTALLSGDAPARARRLAERLGVADVRGGATPEAKRAAIAEAQREGGPVGMVGDGINDGPVLGQADLSIAMGQGALVARTHADAVVVSNRPLDIVAARTDARRALGLVRQNLVWAALYNAACVPLAVLGWLPPWAAGLGMAVSSLVVVLNATRAGR